jgi:mono/diheme cytochrome c family protein
MLRISVALALALLATAAFAQVKGHDVYVTNCSACHQESGAGMPGAFPALAGDKVVTGDPAAVIGVVLKGRGGMPAFGADLSDADVAAAVSYIRSSWGNAAAPVTPAAVTAVRAASAPTH